MISIATPQNVLLGLGANLGACRETLTRAWEEISFLPGVDAVRISGFFETSPVGGPPGQPDYLNAAVLLRTALPPETLLARLQEIENRHGRVRLERWGPRTLDIDLLLYGSLVLDTPVLTLPHPRMLHRRFVLDPANEIVPEMVHPETGRTIAEHLRRLDTLQRAS